MTTKRTRRIRNSKTLYEAYKVYRKTAVNPVSRTTYMAVCRGMNKRFVEALITGEVLDFRLAPHLGRMAIVKRKTRLCNMRIDWKKTKETGVLNYHENLHTRGYFCTLKWWKPYQSKGLQQYRFQLTRTYDRRMSSYFRSGRVDYPVYERKIRVD